MARWVTVRKDAFPIDYRVPESGAWLYFTWDDKDPEEKGERYLPDDQADFMLRRKYATEGKGKGSTTKSRKGKTARKKAVKVAADAAPTDTRPDAVLADAPVVPAGSPDDRSSLDQAAG